MREHSEKWFAKQEKRLKEPLKNTKKYYIRGAILRILSLVLIPKALIDVVLYKYYKTIWENQSADYLGSVRAVTFVGAPGCGKTFTGGANVSIALAGERWAALQRDYYLQASMAERWIEAGDMDKLEAFRSLEESFLYYREREGEYIPCLVSSIPLRDYAGRYSYKLTSEVQLQIKRVPEYTVLFNDESGLSQGAQTSGKTVNEIMDFYRFNRHFGDFYLINTEQGDKGNGIYIRRVTDCNIRLGGQEWLMCPRRRLQRLEKRVAKFIKKKEKGKISAKRAQWLGEKFYYENRYLRTIGFRRIPYRYEQSEGGFVGGEADEYIFPAIGLAEYDSRSFRNQYKCREKEFELEGWSSLIVDENARQYDEQMRKRD